MKPRIMMISTHGYVASHPKLGRPDTHPSAEEQQLHDELRLQATELGISDQVLIGDYIPDELLIDYYRAADVFVLSSRYEPFGMTAVEAMACGTPTVITTHGGLWEHILCGRAALFADPCDGAAFARAICFALTHPSVAQRMSTQGEEFARSGYTWKSIAQRIHRRFTEKVTQEGAAVIAPNFTSSRFHLGEFLTGMRND